MSSQYLLPCSCGQKVPVDLSQAGSRIRCGCGIDLEVPTLLRLKQLEQVVSDLPATKQPSWGARQRFALLGALLSVAGIVIAVWSHVTRPLIVDVAEYPPMATLQLWDSLRQGIDLPPGRMEVWLFSTIQWHHRWTIVGVVVACVGAVVTALSLALGGRSLARRSPSL